MTIKSIHYQGKVISAIHYKGKAVWQQPSSGVEAWSGNQLIKGWVTSQEHFSDAANAFFATAKGIKLVFDQPVTGIEYTTQDDAAYFHFDGNSASIDLAWSGLTVASYVGATFSFANGAKLQPALPYAPFLNGSADTGYYIDIDGNNTGDAALYLKEIWLY